MVKDISKSLAVALLIGLVYLAYIGLVGIPRTKARELYNLAVVDQLEGSLEQSIDKLSEAIKFWPEKYISDFKFEVQTQQDTENLNR